MRVVRRVLTVAILFPVLILLPLGLRADGEEDVPHGMPGVYDDTVLRTGMGLDEVRPVEDEAAETLVAPQLVFDSLEGLWAYIDWIIGAIR